MTGSQADRVNDKTYDVVNQGEVSYFCWILEWKLLSRMIDLRFGAIKEVCLSHSSHSYWLSALEEYLVYCFTGFNNGGSTALTPSAQLRKQKLFCQWWVSYNTFLYSLCEWIFVWLQEKYREYTSYFIRKVYRECDKQVNNAIV